MRSASARKARLNYLKDVLGVENVTLPLGCNRAPNPRYQIGFFEFRKETNPSLELLSYPEPTLTLFQKMVQAMNLNWSSTTHCVCLGNEMDARKHLDGWIQENQLSLVVLFGNDTASMWVGHPTSVRQVRGPGTFNGAIKYYVTFSPSDLISSPEDKRDSWSDLQEIMRDLK